MARINSILQTNLLYTFLFVPMQPMLHIVCCAFPSYAVRLMLLFSSLLSFKPPPTTQQHRAGVIKTRSRFTYQRRAIEQRAVYSFLFFERSNVSFDAPAMCKCLLICLRSYLNRSALHPFHLQLFPLSRRFKTHLKLCIALGRLAHRLPPVTTLSTRSLNELAACRCPRT